MVGGRRTGIFKYITDFYPFLDEYKSSVLAWGSGIVGTVLWIASSIFGSTTIAAAAGATYFVPALGYYLAYRPFGIRVDLTPMVTGETTPTPDKVAEERGEAILRDGKCEIHGGVTISEKVDSFALQFDTPDDIRVELLDIPCEEHDFDRDSNTLVASPVSVRRFSFVILVFLVGEDQETTCEFPLRVRDEWNDRTITSIDVITR